MSPMFRALEVRNYRIYAVGNFISAVGTWMQTTAMAWLILVMTDSGFLVGVSIALQLIPTMVFSPFAGAVADRVNKRRMLIVTQSAMAAPTAVLGLLAVSGYAQVWQILALTFVYGIARAFEAPARQSFVPEMVGPGYLANAVSLNSALFNGGRLIGPAVAGLLIAALGGGVFGAGAVIVINALSFVPSIGAIVMLNVDDLQTEPSTVARKRAVRDGLRYVGSRPDLILVLVVVFFVGAFGMNFQITSALMATEEFGLAAQEFGMFGTILAIGSLGGSLLAARRVRPRLRFIVGSALAFAMVQALSGLMPHHLAYAAILPLIGLTVMTVATSANAMIQMYSSPQVRGRVAAIYLMVFIGSVPIGAPLVGLVAEAFGARIALYATGAIVAVGTLLAAAWYLRTMHLSIRVSSLRHPRVVVGPSLVDEGQRAAEAA